jgi:hypothetical protein
MMTYKFVHTDKGKYQYKVGHSNVVIYTPDGDKHVVHFKDLFGHGVDIERSRWKRTLCVTPQIISDYVKKEYEYGTVALLKSLANQMSGETRKAIEDAIEIIKSAEGVAFDGLKMHKNSHPNHQCMFCKSCERILRMLSVTREE